MRFVEVGAADASAVAVPYLTVERAHLVAPYTLAIAFNTGETRIVDFGSFLRGSSHPAIRAYLSETRFQAFAVVDGNLNWNDYDLIFPVADLYAGKL